MKQIPSFSSENKILLKGILAGLLFLAIAAESHAALSWANKKNELTSEVGAGVVRVAYDFTNTGKTPVSIVDIKPSCGCVATSLEKFDYAPGESGQIKVTFDLGMDEYAKLQKRTIEVITSDSPNSPTVLQLRVHVPETVAASPEMLVWRHGEKPKTKEVVVRAGSGIAAIKLVQTTSSDDFSVEVKPEIEGQRYRLKITPRKTDVPTYADLKFDVESPSFKHRVDCEIQLNVEAAKTGEE